MIGSHCAAKDIRCKADSLSSTCNLRQAQDHGHADGICAKKNLPAAESLRDNWHCLFINNSLPVHHLDPPIVTITSRYQMNRRMSFTQQEKLSILWYFHSAAMHTKSVPNDVRICTRA